MIYYVLAHIPMNLGQIKDEIELLYYREQPKYHVYKIFEAV